MKMRSAARPLVGLVIALSASQIGCGGGTPDPPALDPETYVEVMVALRRAHETRMDPAVYEAERERILREAGVTDSLLVQWVRSRGDDPAFLAALWDSINTRLTAAEDSAR